MSPPPASPGRTGKVRLLPYADFLGVRAIGEANGAPLLEMPFSEGLYGMGDRLHGGAIAGLLEIAAIAAIDATLEGDEDPRQRFKPISATVDFMRPGFGASTYACAEVLRAGQRIANVSARAWQDDPTRPIALGRMNLAIAGRI